MLLKELAQSKEVVQCKEVTQLIDICLTDYENWPGSYLIFPVNIKNQFAENIRNQVTE